jgi:uncharacterized membrane protein
MAEATEKSPQSAFTLFAESKRRVLKNPTPFAILTAISLVLALVAGQRGSHASYTTGLSFDSFSWGLLGVGLILGIAFLIINFIIQVMQYVLSLETAKGHKPTLDEAYEVARKFWLRELGLAILIGLITFVGFLALIVPGLIFLRRYYLAPYVMIAEDLSAPDAMTRSAELSKPYSGAVWGLIGITVLIGLSGAIPLVGPVITSLLSMLFVVAPSLRYYELKKLVKA